MRRFSRLIAGLVFAFARSADAFDFFPEYQTLTRNEAESFSSPLDVDSEYQSDVLAYMPRLEDEFEFEARTGAFDLELGSLSGKQFLFYERLKLEKALTPWLSFRFLHFIQEDAEEDQEHALVELRSRLRPRLGVAVYGEPSREKEDVDVGAALLILPEERHEVRIFHTWTDIVREKRNLLGDRFISQQNPNSLGVLGLRSDPDSRLAHLRYFFRRDLPARWLLPSDAREYTYAKTVAGFDAKWLSSDSFAIETRWQWDRTHEGQLPLGGSPLPVEQRRRDRLQALVSPVLTDSASKWTWRPGLLYVEREWRASAARNGQHSNWLPHIWLEIPTLERAKGATDEFQIGLEFTHFEAQGTPGFLNRPQPYRETEGRLNLRYEFAFADHARLSFLVSADLDEFGTSTTFEGGHGHFQVFF